MKIAVVGLWHLGTVTAACLAAAGHQVIAVDQQKAVITGLQQQQLPVFEPGLGELIGTGIQTNNLIFTTDLQEISNAEIVWITYDTPVDENDKADINFVKEKIIALFPYLAKETIVLISSQLPVGSTRSLQMLCDQAFPNKMIYFAYSPENLRLGKAIEVFNKPERVVIGIDKPANKQLLTELFQSFTSNILWMTIESAEMTKHAINTFLATSVVFANELACLCEDVGADMMDVERGLKSENRIGPKAYLRAGNAFAGGTLARDVSYLLEIGQNKNINSQLLSAVITSNIHHRQWVNRKLKNIIGDLQNKTIAVLGLTYKPDTNTLRRSTAIEFCFWLKQQQAKIQAFDPVINNLSEDLKQFIHLTTNIDDALKNADAVVIATEWQQFGVITPTQIIAQMQQPIVIDVNGFLRKQLQSESAIKYFSLGRSQ